MQNIVYIGLGSNLDQPMQQVTRALTQIDAIESTQLIRCSPWFQSKAVGPVQPDFINGAAKVSTALPPHAFLDALQRIEHNHQRVRLEHWGPRTLDLDILLWNNETINTDRLTVPHAYLTQRSFVLLPLHAIDPDLTLPCGSALETLIKACDLQGISPVA